MATLLRYGNRVRVATFLALSVLIPVTLSLAGEAGSSQSGTADPANVIYANPFNYLFALTLLRAGDTLMLDPGIYEGAHGAKRVRRPPGSRRAGGFVGVRAIARA